MRLLYWISLRQCKAFCGIPPRLGSPDPSPAENAQCAGMLSRMSTSSRAPGGESVAKVQRKRIGDILVETGVISAQQLTEALARQRRTRERLGRILVEQKVATEKQIAQALAAQLDLPLVNLASARIDPKAVKLVPEALARKRRVLPLVLEGEHLVIAMADPLDVYAVDDVGIAAHRPVKAGVAGRGQRGGGGARRGAGGGAAPRAAGGRARGGGGAGARREGGG